MGEKEIRRIGVLTAGGDCPGLNAAIRAVGKACVEKSIEVIGIRDGFRGLVENRTWPMERGDFSGILTLGGTILGTGRDKPNKITLADGRVADMTDVAAANYERLGLDCLVCLGGGGTQKNALHLAQEGGMDVLTLPKTIDNDIWGTDVSFGYDTAVAVATDAIDRLHSTAESHHRVMVLEVMGNRVGWIALAAGLAGGADVILLPELPYEPQAVAEAILARERMGKRFSIVCIAEGAFSREEVKKADGQLPKAESRKENAGSVIAREILELTGIETRVTVLGHVQRGGCPTSTDRILATRLGAYSAKTLSEGVTGVMIASRGECCEAVPLEKVAGKRKDVPPDHPLMHIARAVGISLGE